MANIDKKKNEYWNYFIANKKFHGSGFTAKRLEKVKIVLWNDNDFWSDILMRHDGVDRSPEQIKQESKATYLHCMGNMMGMISHAIYEMSKK